MKPENEGKGDNKEKSENLKEYLFESSTPNNLKYDYVGSVSEDLEKERKEMINNF